MATSTEPLTAWQWAWRTGVAPQLSLLSLEALQIGLERDNPALLQGATVSPPPLQCLADRMVEAACPIAYCGWRASGLATVAQLEAYFARVCYEAGVALGQPDAVRSFINWWDESPREEARRALLAEVGREIDRRQQPLPVKTAA